MLYVGIRLNLLTTCDLQVSSLAIFLAGVYGWFMAVADDLEIRFQVMCAYG